MQQIEHERRIQSRFRFLPEWIICFCTFRRGVFYEIVDQLKHVRILANVAKWVIAVRFGWVDQVKDTQHIPLLQKQISDGTEHFALWVSDDKTRIGKHEVGFCEEACLARTGAADDDLQQVSAVQLAVHAHLQMLRQNDVFACILVAVLFIQFPNAAP